MNITIRRATTGDLDFIVETIVAAEKSNTDKFSYSTIFEVEEQTFKGILKEMLKEDIRGQELCYSDFLIAEAEGKKAAAVAAWVENRQQPSAIKKGTLLSYFIPAENLQKARKKQWLLDEIKIDRSPGALQIESVYVRPEFRGLGLSGRLIRAHMDEWKDRPGTAGKVQVILAKNNEGARKAYLKMGFETTLEKCSEIPELLDILPSNSKILMERSFD